ncbi:MAG: nuclear transport factor 2 family protein [Pseudomonadota bacterium]
MADAKAVERLILDYFHSWQEPSDFDAFRACLADDIAFDGGAMKIEGADALTDMIKQTGSPWQDVTLLASIFNEDGGALFYDGAEKQSGTQMRVAEHITVTDGRISRVIAAISQTPPQG